MDRRPIGVFDSGVGGLTVVKELIKVLPQEDIIYFGDTARLPYGTKSQKTIIRFSTENAFFLLKHKVKLIVVACNSSSSAALNELKKNFKVPVIGVIEPGAKEGVLNSRNKRIGVIGTSATIKRGAYKKRIIKSDSSVKVFSQNCPLLVPLAEEGWLNNKIAIEIIKHYLLPLKKKNIDTLILGCTHYPLLKSGIRKVIGKKVKLIDSAISAAKAIKRLMLKENILSGSGSKGSLKFFVSDEPDKFKKTGEKFLGRRLLSVRKVGYGL